MCEYKCDKTECNCLYKHNNERDYDFIAFCILIAFILLLFIVPPTIVSCVCCNKDYNKNCNYQLMNDVDIFKNKKYFISKGEKNK